MESFFRKSCPECFKVIGFVEDSLRIWYAYCSRCEFVFVIREDLDNKAQINVSDQEIDKYRCSRELRISLEGSEKVPQFSEEKAREEIILRKKLKRRLLLCCGT